jgi:hypothetical protein
MIGLLIIFGLIVGAVTSLYAVNRAVISAIIRRLGW